MQTPKAIINIGVAIHDNSEVITGMVSFPILMRVDISDELGHLAFSLGGSCLSGVLVWIIKKYLDNNADRLFNKFNKYFKGNNSGSKNSRNKKS